MRTLRNYFVLPRLKSRLARNGKFPSKPLLCAWWLEHELEPNRACGLKCPFDAEKSLCVSYISGKPWRHQTPYRRHPTSQTNSFGIEQWRVQSAHIKPVFIYGYTLVYDPTTCANNANRAYEGKELGASYSTWDEIGAPWQWPEIIERQVQYIYNEDGDYDDVWIQLWVFMIRNQIAHIGLHNIKNHWYLVTSNRL